MASGSALATASFNFRQIPVVPNSQELSDICLSKTQRRTPNEIHKNFQISRIRSFYMRKVKFLQQSYAEKLDEMISFFPHIDKIHPFHADMINILYDKDHYKIALSQLNTCKKLIDKVSNDYIKLLKYGESLYRCKMLKVAAFGRMTKLIKNQNEGLKYLESVRQHMTRLPTINPSQRTIILSGLPNVGKSSFLNSISAANVDVQPYPFTTRSIYVGAATAFELPWQILDTPGLLDKPLLERNSIEMLSITALAHLKAAVIYFMDVSESCGYSFEEQINLFENIKPLFTNRPLIIALNKSDQMKFDELSGEKQQILKEICSSTNPPIPCFEISTKLNENVSSLKKEACRLLLKERVQAKLSSYTKADSAASKLKVFYPDNWDPQKIQSHQKKMDETEIDSEEMLRKVQEYYKSPRRAVKIANPHEKDDKIPEIYLGYNVADFVHESVTEKLSEVVKQEESRDKEGFYYISQLDPIYLEETRERRQLANLLIQKRKLARMHSHLKQGRSNNNPILSKVLKAQKSSQKQRYFNNKKQEENLNKVLENHPNSELTVKNLNESQSKDLKLSVTSQRAIVKARKSKEKSNVFAQESNNRNYNKTPKHLYVGKVNVKGKRDHR